MANNDFHCLLRNEPTRSPPSFEAFFFSKTVIFWSGAAEHDTHLDEPSLLLLPPPPPPPLRITAISAFCSQRSNHTAPSRRQLPLTSLTRRRSRLCVSPRRWLQVIADLEEEKRRHAEDTAEGDDVTYILEKEKERLQQQVGADE